METLVTGMKAMGVVAVVLGIAAFIWFLGSLIFIILLGLGVYVTIREYMNSKKS